MALRLRDGVRIGVLLRKAIPIMLRRIWPAVLLFMIAPGSQASSVPASLPAPGIALREGQMFRALRRAAQFANVPRLASRPCEDIQPPEALTTPDPLFSPLERGRRIKVSFIIGTDGRVHSPLILESAGYAGDRHVLQTVRSWKYRPATCNGVPMETEGKVEFSRR